MQLNLCPLLERLNISHCAELTDESINSLGMSDAVLRGRWDSGPSHYLKKIVHRCAALSTRAGVASRKSVPVSQMP